MLWSYNSLKLERFFRVFIGFYILLTLFGTMITRKIDVVKLKSNDIKSLHCYAYWPNVLCYYILLVIHSNYLQERKKCLTSRLSASVQVLNICRFLDYYLAFRFQSILNLYYIILVHCQIPIFENILRKIC